MSVGRSKAPRRAAPPESPSAPQAGNRPVLAYSESVPPIEHNQVQVSEMPATQPGEIDSPNVSYRVITHEEVHPVGAVPWRSIPNTFALSQAATGRSRPAHHESIRH